MGFYRPKFKHIQPKEEEKEERSDSQKINRKQKNYLPKNSSTGNQRERIDRDAAQDYLDQID